MNNCLVKSAQTEFWNGFSVCVREQWVLWVRIVICVKW